MRLVFLLPALLLLLAACGADEPAAPGTPPAGPVSHLLDADLPDAVGVMVGKLADEGAEVTIFGRVRRAENGVFTLVDDAHVEYCGQAKGREDDHCATPWDYCCEDQEQVTLATVVVDARTADGQAVPRGELGVRALDLVAVKGVLKHEAEGVVVLEARSGWFLRDRPDVHDGVRWP